MPTEQEGMPLLVSHGVDQMRNKYITEQLKAYNKAHTASLVSNVDDLPVVAPLEIYVLDNKGAVIGGLLGRTHSIREWEV